MAGALSEVLGEVLVSADGEEVAVSALAARGVSLVGLYFGCSLGGSCAQLGASLAAFYGRFRGEAAAAGGQRLEIVFVSAEQEQQQWQEAVRAMPWLALPFADKHRKVRPGGRRGKGGEVARPGLCLGAAGLGRVPPHPGPAGAGPAGCGVGAFQKVPGRNRGEGGEGVGCRPAGRRRLARLLRAGRARRLRSPSTGWGEPGPGGGGSLRGAGRAGEACR